MPDFKKKFSVYKANKAGKGSAMQFDFNKEKQAVFVEAAAQLPTGEQAFDWGNKLIFKLGVSDIAKILTVLNGKSKAVDLFHDPTKSRDVQQRELAPGVAAKKNATLSFSTLERGHYAKLNIQDQTGKVSSVGVSVSDDEAVVLKLLLEDAIRQSYAW